MGWTNTGKRAKPERKPELTIPAGGKEGQRLVMRGGHLKWEDVTLKISFYFKEAEHKYVCDKTYSEVKEAFDNGTSVFATFGTAVMQLFSLSGGGQFVFRTIFHNLTDEYAALTSVVFSRDDSVMATRSKLQIYEEPQNDPPAEE